MSTCLEARQGDECGSPDHDDHVTSQKRGLPSCKVYFIINTQQEEKRWKQASITIHQDWLLLCTMCKPGRIFHSFHNLFRSVASSYSGAVTCHNREAAVELSAYVPNQIRESTIRLSSTSRAWLWIQHSLKTKFNSLAFLWCEMEKAQNTNMCHSFTEIAIHFYIGTMSV